jgi:hypothetical protein
LHTKGAHKGRKEGKVQLISSDPDGRIKIDGTAGGERGMESFEEMEVKCERKILKERKSAWTNKCGEA